MTCDKSKFKAEMVIHAESGDKFFTGNLRCKQWGCDYCRDINVRNLRNRIKAMVEGYLVEHSVEPAKERFWIKMLTLTMPGKLFREKTSSEDMEKIIGGRVRHFFKKMRLQFAPFEYVWVQELQADGTPHIHALLIGAGISGVEILPWIRAMWCGTLEMGNVDLKVAGSAHKVINYMVGYLLKGKLKHTKGKRVFRTSNGLKYDNRKMPVTLIKLWAIGGDGSLTLLYDCEDYNQSVEKIIMENNLKELLEFFETETKPKQGELEFDVENHGQGGVVW